MKTALHPGLLGLPVTVNGIELARTVRVLLDAANGLVGFELRCRDGSLRFLPAGAADVRPGEIQVASALVFLEERELGWYRERTLAG